MFYCNEKTGKIYTGDMQKGDRIASIDEILKLKKREKMAEINSIYEDVVNKYCNGAPQTEKQTWSIQSAEAFAWEKDNDSPTPRLDKIATARGVERVELIKKALLKAKAYEDYCFTMTGQRQKYEDMVDSATTIEEVEAIQWEE